MSSSSKEKTIVIHDIPPSLDQETLELFLENRRNGGGDIEDLQFDANKGTAVVTFQDAEVATHLLKAGHILIEAHDLCVVPPPQEITNDSVLYVYDVPSNMTEPLQDCLESKRKGGGKIIDFTYNDTDHLVVAKFEDPQVVEYLMKSETITLLDKTFYLSTTFPDARHEQATHSTVIDSNHTVEGHGQHVETDVESSSNRTVYIDSVPDNMEQILRDYLENSRHGGGEVENFDFDDERRVATVTFADASVSAGFLEKKTICLICHTMNVTSVPPPDLHTDGVIMSDAVSPININDSFADLNSLGEIDSVDASDQEDFGRSIFIENVPEEMYAFLEIVLESKNSGGGTIRCFEPDSEAGRVLVTFEDPEVAKKLLEAGEVNFGGSTVLPVVAVKRPSECPTVLPPVNVIKVSGIPKSLPHDILKTFLESEKIGGGKVTKVDFNNRDGTAVVEFENSQVAQHLLEAGHIQYKQTVFQISQPLESPSASYPTDSATTDEKDDDLTAHESDSGTVDVDTEADSHDDELQSSIRVTGIPEKFTEDTLLMFFENKKRSGGGKIEKLNLQADGTAMITFADAEVAKALLEKGEVKNGEYLMHIVAPDMQSTHLTASSSVEVKGVTSKVNKEMLIMFLENNRRSGGGNIKEYNFDDSNGSALVTFEDEQIAASLVQKGQLEFMGSILTVTRPTSECSQTTTSNHEWTDNLDDIVNKQQQQQPPRTIEVRGLSKEMTQDQLELYFENKRSGGGAIDDISMSDGSACITFKDPNDAMNVAKKAHHVLSNVRLNVTLLDTWPETTTCAVKVENLAGGTSEETISLFFENKKRSGGGPIEEIAYDLAKKFAVITFQDRLTAGCVAGQKSLSLNGSKLSVEWLKPGHPPPVFVDKDGLGVCVDCLLYVSLPNNIQADSLNKYAHMAAGIDVLLITFSPQPGRAIVKYTSPPDYERVRMMVCSKPCCGQMISVQRLPQSKSLQVHNIGSLGKERLELYFESERRSGGGDIKEMKMDQGCAMLEFVDMKVMNRVLSKTHIIDNQTLQVEPYFPSFGILPPGFDSSKPFQALPQDVLMDCSPEVAHFIIKNKPLKHKIETLLKCDGCFVKWPKDRTEKLVLHCNIDVSEPDAYSKIKDWSERCQEKMKKELDAFSFGQDQVLNEIWKEVKGKVEAGLKSSPDQIIIHWDDGDCVVYACGFKAAVDQFQAAVRKIRADLEEELAKSKKRITENMGLKPHQLFLIQTLDLDVHYKNNGVDIKVTDKVVTLSGQPREVMNVKLDILQKVNNIKSSSVELPSANFLKLIDRPPCKAHLHAQFSKRKLRVTFDVLNSEIMVYGFEDKDVDMANSLIKSEFTSSSITLNPKCLSFLRSHQWKDFLSNLSKQFQLAEVSVVQSQVNICAVRQECQSVESKIQDFLDNTVIVEKFIPVSAGIVKVLTDYGQTRIDKLKQELGLGQHTLTFEMDSDRFGYYFKVPLGAVLKTENGLKKLIGSVVKRDHRIEPIYTKFMNKVQTKLAVSGIAVKNKVVINYPEDETYSLSAQSSTAVAPYVYSEATLPNGKVIRLVIGDIVKYSADVIVNAANSRLQHGAGVAGAISQAGGPKVDQECSEYIDRNGQMKPGDVFLSTAGNLSVSFKAIVHTVGPIWKHGRNNEERDLELAVRAALVECDRHSFKSVSLPAISCGIYGFPVMLGRKIILEEIAKFLQKPSSVREVSVVSGKGIVVQFHEALTEIAGQSKVKIIDNQIKETSVDDNAEEDMDFEDLGNEDFASTGDQKVYASFKTPEGIMVTLLKGSIVTQKVDVIFNSTEKDLNLGKGYVSKLILAAAGGELQKECQTRYPQGINYGQIAKTGGFKLPVKSIYHGAACKWDGGAGLSEKVVRQLVSCSLKTAHDDGMVSIAFPAIGAGSLKIPHELVASAMFDEVKKFSASMGRTSSIHDVYFVVYDRDQLTVNAFEKELRLLHAGGISNSGHSSFRSHGPIDKTHTFQQQQQQQQQQQNVEKIDCVIGDINFQVKCGDITHETCDVIVNSTNEKLDLRLGALSKTILKAAGDSILQECKQIGVASDGLAVTGAGRLKCRHIFHVVLKNDMKLLKQVISRCFMEAEKRQLTSLAMPTLGTGRTGAGSAKEIAQAIFEEVASFADTKPQYLKKIIVTTSSGTVELFVAAVEGLDKGNPLWKKYWDKIKEKVVTFAKWSSSSSSAPSDDRVSQSGKQVTLTAPAKHHQPMQPLVLCVYSLLDKSIDVALREINELCKESKQQTEVTSREVCLLTAEQEDKLKALAKVHDVSIQVFRNKRDESNSKIVVEGIVDSVALVVPAVWNMLLEIKDREKQEREIELLAKQAVWELNDGQTYKPYDTQGRGTLEKAHTENKKSAEWTDSGGKHVVSLVGTQWEDVYNGKKMVVRRIDPAAAVALPSHWDPMPPNQDFVAVTLNTSSQEYVTVQNSLASSAPGAYRTIVKIERIQNPFLYRQYMTKKTQIDQRNPTGQNEMLLWHGTAGNNIQNINARNFNRSYGGQHGLAIGNGVYFATAASYSLSGTYSPADPSTGHRHLYQARVLIGKHTPGQSGLREPPAGYDSVSGSGMFVVFYDAQTYPEYLLTLT